MRRGRLLDWIGPAVIVAIIAVYVGGVVSGRWEDPTGARAAGTAMTYPESSDPEHRKARAELCTLINRPEILELVDRPATVKGVGTSYDPNGDWRQCTVTLPNGSLRLNVWHGRTRLADYRKLFPEAQPRTVLERQAIWLADSSTVGSMTVKEATLLVAWDRADSGGMVEVSMIRGVVDSGDENALTQIAERQLPALPGWPV
jgi:hypothetical protein